MSHETYSNEKKNLEGGLTLANGSQPVYESKQELISPLKPSGNYMSQLP
jgi:hypothetical protein